MTPEELEIIRERCEKATPGPWIDDGYRIHLRNREGPVFFEHKYNENFGRSDGEFICRSREDIPALLTYIDELEAQLENFRIEDDGAEYLHQGNSAYRKTLCDKIRRERIATACLQGLLNGAVVYEKGVKPRIVYLRAAEDAVAYTDALIVELDREDPK